MKKFKIFTIIFMLFISYQVSYAQNDISPNKDTKKDNTKKEIPKLDNTKKDPTKPFDDIIYNPEKPNNVITGKDVGQVDWTEQMITAKGYSVIDTVKFKNKSQAQLMATRGAIVVAQRNLLETIQGVRIVSETTVKDFVTESDYVYSRLDGICKGAEMVGDPIVKDGIVTVTMQVPIYKPGNNSKDTASVASLIQKKYSTTPPPTVTAPKGNNTYTGPTLLPKVLDESGNIVVDYTKYVDPKTGKFPKYLNLTKEVLNELQVKEGVDIIDAVQENDGSLKIDTGQVDKVAKWAKIGKTAIKIGKFIMLLI